MQLAARHSLAATVALTAVGVIAVTPGVTPVLTPRLTPPRLEVRSPAVQATGDSSVFLPLPVGDPGFDKEYFDGLLTVDRDTIGALGDLAGPTIDGLNGANAIVHETDFIENPLTSLFNANGIVVDPADASAIAPALNLETPGINGAVNGSSLGAADGAGSQAAALAGAQGPFLTADLANAMSAFAVDLANLEASLTTLGNDLASAGEDFSSNIVVQSEALGEALQDLNTTAFVAALQNLINTAAFEAVLAQDLPAVFQDVIAFGNVVELGQIIGMGALLGAF